MLLKLELVTDSALSCYTARLLSSLLWWLVMAGVATVDSFRGTAPYLVVVMSHCTPSA